MENRIPVWLYKGYLLNCRDGSRVRLSDIMERIDKKYDSIIIELKNTLGREPSNDMKDELKAVLSSITELNIDRIHLIAILKSITDFYIREIRSVMGNDFSFCSIKNDDVYDHIP